MSDGPVVLINVLTVKPENREALLTLLKQNTEQVIRSLAGWKSTRLISVEDCTRVVIYSEWERAAAVEAMRNDKRMQAYFPRILQLASLDSMVGSVALSERPSA